MQKRNLINHIYTKLQKSRVTSGIYSDNDWRHVTIVFNEIDKILENIFAKRNERYGLAYGETRYEGVIGELGHRKVYEFSIMNDDEKEVIGGQLICSFCGTMSDPMGSYDVTVILW